MTRASPKQPLIAIVGATGTGKSQLAVELAKRYNGEVINGDAMQLYTGLPIITNKISDEEQQGIPHHLLGCIGLNEQTWVVGMFVKKALRTIEEIRSRGKLPILVGGTHYYLQSLLFKDRLANRDVEPEKRPFVPDTRLEWPILQENTPVLLDELRRVDPVMADRWHPNDRRKIQRSLEIYLQTGRKASDIYAEQRQRKIDGSLTDDQDTTVLDSPTLRFPTLLFWVHAEPAALNARLEKRVDKMLEHGLLDEVRTMDDVAAEEAAKTRPVDETRGIWVSIGYKEFKPYMPVLHNGTLSEQEMAAVKADCLEKTNIATRQYAKRQVRWIRIKLVNALREASAHENLYLLDGTEIASSNDNVITPAIQLTHNFLTANSNLPDPSSLSTAAAEMLTPKRDYDLSAQPEKWSKRYCDLCDVTCVTEDSWNMHAKSKAHRKLVSKRKKAADEHTGG